MVPTALGTTERCLTTPAPAGRRRYSVGDTRTDARVRRASKDRDATLLGRYVLPNTGVSGCAKRAIEEQDGTVKPIEVRCDDEAGAYLTGVRFCSSPWFCPRCSPKVLYRRGQEIDRICRAVFDNGGSIFLLTLTVRHSSRDSAQRLVDFVMHALSKVLKGGRWTRLAKRLGYIGLTRVAEVTCSDASGYHPHIHAALCFDRKLTDAEYAHLLRKLRKWWVELVADPKHGLGRTVVPHRAVDLREWVEAVDAVFDADGNEISGTGEGHSPARYLTKIGHGWGIGNELAGANVKAAKGRSMNPAQLVSAWISSHLAGNPDRRLEAVIKELFKATKGRHMTHTSANLRKWVAERTDDIDEVEKTDEELAHEDVGGEAVVEIDPEVYAWIDRLQARTDVLDGVEDSGLNGAVEALRDRGMPVVIAYRPAAPESDRQPAPLIKFDRSWIHRRTGPVTCRASKPSAVIRRNRGGDDHGWR